MKYVILSPGRTGSTFLLNVMATSQQSGPGGICCATQYRYPYDVDAIKKNAALDGNMVIHTHWPSVFANLNLDTSETVLVISRRNLFDTVMSLLVARVTNEWSESEYTNKTPEPIHIDLRKAYEEIVTVSEFYKKVEDICNTQQFVKIINVDYEDLEFTTEYVAELLGISDYDTNTVIVNSQSPYNYKHWISNWQEILALFNAYK